jgi:tetratricopeptide (TPR) repeat protein
MKISKSTRIKIIGALIIFNVLIFFNGIKNEFVWDDQYIVEKNELIKDPDNIMLLLTSEDSPPDSPPTGFYRPLINLSFLMDYQIFKGEPYGYRLTNILLHILCVVFLLYITFMLTDDIMLSYMAAIIFSAQAVHVEAVTFITGRNNILCALFILISIYYYIKSIKLSKPFYFVISMVSLFLGATSKEFAFLVPLVFILYDYTFDEEFSVKKGLKRYIISFAVIFLFIILKSTLISLGRSISFDPETLYLRIINTQPIMVKYMLNQIVPYNLSLHLTPEIIMSILNPNILISSAIFLAVTSLAFIYRKKYKLLSFSFFTYLIFLIPVSNIVKLPSTIMADRWLYVASCAFSLVLARGIMLLIKDRRLATVVTILFALFLSVFTIQRNHTFKTNMLLYEDTAKKHPNSVEAKNNYATELTSQGKYDEAEEQYRMAIKLNPYNFISYNNIGMLYGKKGEFSKALDSYKKAFELNNNHPLLASNLAFSYRRAGKLDKSNEYFLRAISLNKKYVDAYFELASNYYEQGKYQEALNVLDYVSTTFNYKSVRSRAMDLSTLINNEINGK